MKRLLSAATLSVLLLAGCGDELRLDASGDDALKDSLERISENLTPGEAEELGRAIVYVAMRGAFRGGSGIGSLDGMTAREAIAFVDKAKAESDANKRSKALAEIEVLKLEREIVMAEIRPITVNGVAYGWPDDYSDALRVTYTVTNGGDIALGGIYMRVTVASPGRSKPWTVDDSPVGIDGGLEPGESREFRTSAGRYSVAWNELGLVGRDDLEVTVEVIGVETRMYHGSNITRIDERLHDLQERAAESTGDDPLLSSVAQ